MAKFFPALDDALVSFIHRQKIFFTATAPQEGRINLSPKGTDSFRCLDAHTVAYLDLTGSGNEASAHLLENGRMTIMFCSFDEKPLILRLYGHGRSILPEDPEWTQWMVHFNETPGQRQIVLMTVESAQTSCGFAVPRFDFHAERGALTAWVEKQGPQKMVEYRQQKNRVSIDGLTARLTAR